MESPKIDTELLKGIPLPDYDADANKADYGKLLLVAGSRRLPGAAILAARAALRVGCGTVRAALPESIATAVGVAVPELMVLPLPETTAGTLSLKALAELEKQYKFCDAAVLGPGLDENAEVERLCQGALAACPLPMVVDAQALASFEKGEKYPAPRLLTPHAREMSELLGARKKTTVENAGEKEREKLAAEFAGDALTLVLKGRQTLIAGEGVLYRNEAGTRGLGTAGSGDVLSGFIGGLLAQGVAPSTAAAWGVHIHALAGEAAEKDLGDDGLTASDIVLRAPGVLRYLRRHVAPTRETAERAGLRRR